ncbi:hypothetical protein FQN54_003482 [Arachnomyces sp. PD_36]|nr:hypothetical protein FQN54_003482 [Arachnomyces sp. PD_36]
MLPPPTRAFRPAPPDSPSTSLMGMERAIPPDRSFPPRSGRSLNFDKPLPALPTESPSRNSCRGGNEETVDLHIYENEDPGSSREMSQEEREAYDEWWNQQNRKYSETVVSSQATIGENRESCVSLRGFLSGRTETGRTPAKTHPDVLEKEKEIAFSDPKDQSTFQTAATDALGRWKRAQVTGSEFISCNRMSQCSLVPPPLNLSHEQVNTSVDTMSRFSSSDSDSDSEVDAPQSPTIRGSVLSYMRKMSRRKPSGRKKGKQPASSMSSVVSLGFPEGCIPPHYTAVYDIRPTVSRASIQRGVDDLEKRMRVRSVSCASDMAEDSDFGYTRFSGGSRYGYGDQVGEGSQRSEDCRSSGSCGRRGQQLAVPTSPYQKYGPQIWDPPGPQKIRKGSARKSKNRSEGGDGTMNKRESMLRRFLTFKIWGRKSNNPMPQRSKEGVPRTGEPRSPSSQRLDPNSRGHSQEWSQSRSRSRSQLTEVSEYVEAFYRGTDQVTSTFDMAKKKLGISTGGDKRRKELKRSIVVLKPSNCFVGRARSEQWV